MKGVEYLFDDSGQPKLALIDLKKHRHVWEDFQDFLVARQRRNEPRVSLEEVEASLLRRGKKK